MILLTARPIPPCTYVQPDQLYLVIAMRDCGRDLEKASIASFDQARSLLAQVSQQMVVQWLRPGEGQYCQL